VAWKIERWLEDVFPGGENTYSAYRDLPERELVIVAAAVLDSALASALELRLCDYQGEIESFLGANGDGRAPAASFGARIQLGLLVGLLTLEDAAVLRALKNVRNPFAHRAQAAFTSPALRKPVRALYDAWLRHLTKQAEQGVIDGDLSKYRKIEKFLESDTDAAAGLILAILVFYQASFYLLHEDAVRIKPIE
jgi:hypothetical protein